MQDKETPTKRRELFVEELTRRGTVYHAAKAAGIARSLAYRWREQYPAFAQAWDDAKEDATEILEDSMYQRALGGDTTAGIFMLKAMRPEKYRENLKVDHSGSADVTITYVNDWRSQGPPES